MWWNGWRVRAATIMDDGAARYFAEVRLRRVRCGECGHDWVLRPRRVVERRHFQPCVIARAIAAWGRGASLERAAALASCSRRSLGRWLRWVRCGLCSAAGAWGRFASRVVSAIAGAQEIVPEVARCALR